jgi:hypothetical protein
MDSEYDWELSAQRYWAQHGSIEDWAWANYLRDTAERREQMRLLERWTDQLMEWLFPKRYPAFYRVHRQRPPMQLMYLGWNPEQCVDEGAITEIPIGRE